MSKVPWEKFVRTWKPLTNSELSSQLRSWFPSTQHSIWNAQAGFFEAGVSPERFNIYVSRYFVSLYLRNHWLKYKKKVLGDRTTIPPWHHQQSNITKTYGYWVFFTSLFWFFQNSWLLSQSKGVIKIDSKCQ